MAMDAWGKIQELKVRGEALLTAISSLPSDVLTADCRARLLKLVQAERRFLERLATRAGSAVDDAYLSSSNFVHLEGVVFVLRQQGWRVSGAYAALKTFPISSFDSSVTTRREDEDEFENEEQSPLSRFNGGKGCDFVGTLAHVDVVCTLLGEPVWVLVISSSAHNRSWADKGEKKGICTRIRILLHAAFLSSIARPSAVVLVVRGALERRMEQQLQEEFNALKMSRDGLGMPDSDEDTSLDTSWNFQDVEEGDWVDIHVSSKAKQWTSYWIYYRQPHSRRSIISKTLETKHVLAACNFQEDPQEHEIISRVFSIVTPSPFRSVIERLQIRHETYDELKQEGRIMNLDTTALVALVSEMTNGGARKLVHMSLTEREGRFPKMAKFVHEQALAELDRPFLPLFDGLLSDKLPIVCEYVYDEFTSITLTNGGPYEKQRAQEILSHVKVVPNKVSTRVAALPETGKIKARHKLVFGSGDFFQAPTVTANMSFVRAVNQRGLALAIIQHQPCALTRD